MESNVQKNHYEPLPLGVSGLGGWLVLVQIGLYGSILLTIFQIINTIPMFNSESWWMLTSPHSPVYHPLWVPLIIFETIYAFAMIIFCIFILVRFYQKKAIVPRLMIVFYSVSLLCVTIDTLLYLQIPFLAELETGNPYKDMIRSAIGSAIWIPYFLKSVRVRNTFVN